MNGSTVDPIHVWEFAAVLFSLVLSRVAPSSCLELIAPVTRSFTALAQRRVLAICVVATAAFCGDALSSWNRPPVPTTFDEFSYLLAADTFAHGRMTNPTPPMPEFFEAPEVLVTPSRQSKYPPGQALFLALGQRLTGSPLPGLWLSSALACAAICWMLQAWTAPSWAFYGGLLAAVRLAWFGPWAQSYWGGMAAALGGALLFGGLRRVCVGNPRWQDATWLALGVVVLANTRPFEGLLATIPALIFLGWHFASERGQLSRQFTRVVLPVLLIFLLGAAAMLSYNRRVTGNMWRLPYAAYESQYDPVPSFIFQQLRATPRFDNATMQASAQDTLWTWRWQHGSGRLIFITGKLFEFWQFLFGAALSTALVLLVWVRPYAFGIRLTQTAVFLLTQSLALFHLFWPTPSVPWIMVLLISLMGQLLLLLAIFRERWEGLAVLTLILVACGISLETWRFHSHYVGPIVALAWALIVISLEQAKARIFALFLPVLIFGTTLADSSHAPGILDQWAQKRRSLQKQLESEPGKQLVLVYYRPNHDLYEEWVHNPADLEAAPVVWARSRSAEENCQLVKFFSDRKIWSLDADRGVLNPYSSDCSAAPGPDELVPNQ